jgi:hypothetical protein
MTKYMLLYRAPVSAAEQMAGADPAAAQAGMDAWMAWGDRAGSALVDMGSPLQPVSGAGEGDPIGGYAIMQAESPEALQAVLEGTRTQHGEARSRSSSSSQCPASEFSARREGPHEVSRGVDGRLPAVAVAFTGRSGSACTHWTR